MLYQGIANDEEERPKFIAYQALVKRQNTFRRWPEFSPVSVEDLVKAGFFYTGLDFAFSCFLWYMSFNIHQL